MAQAAVVSVNRVGFYLVMLCIVQTLLSLGCPSVRHLTSSVRPLNILSKLVHHLLAPWFQFS